MKYVWADLQDNVLFRHTSYLLSSLRRLVVRMTLKLWALPRKFAQWPREEGTSHGPYFGIVPVAACAPLRSDYILPPNLISPLFEFWCFDRHRLRLKLNKEQTCSSTNGYSSPKRWPLSFQCSQELLAYKTLSFKDNFFVLMWGHRIEVLEAATNIKKFRIPVLHHEVYLERLKE